MQTLSIDPGVDSASVRRRALVAAGLGILAGSSSLVFVEPAPYDLLAIALLAILTVNGIRFPGEVQLPVLFLGLFVGGNLIAAIASGDPAGTIRSLSIRIYMPLTWLLLVSAILVDPPRMLRAIWLGYLFAAFLATAWGCLEYFGFLSGEQWLGGLRAKGPFKDPNVFGSFLVPAAIYALSQLAKRRPGVDTFIYAGLFILFVLGILLSFSRGAWMNFSVSFLLFSIFACWTAPTYRHRVGWLVAGTALLAAGSLAVAGAISMDVVGKRFAQRATLVQRYDTARGGRFDTQIHALTRAAENPLGVGPGRSDDAFGLEPHNLYLHALIEGGWLAFIGLLAFLGWTLLSGLHPLRRRWQLRTETAVIYICTAGTLLQSLFIDSTHWRHLWLLLALLCAVTLAERRLRRPNHYALMYK